MKEQKQQFKFTKYFFIIYSNISLVIPLPLPLLYTPGGKFHTNFILSGMYSNLRNISIKFLDIYTFHTLHFTPEIPLPLIKGKGFLGV